MYQTGLAKFDPSRRVRDHSDSGRTQQRRVAAIHGDAVECGGGRKGLTNNAGARVLLRLDLATRTWEAFEPFKGIAGAHQTYGIASDSKNNIYFMDFAGRESARSTPRRQEQPVPAPTAASRRVAAHGCPGPAVVRRMDGDRIGVFDTKTETFKNGHADAMDPLHVVADKNGEAWTAE